MKKIASLNKLQQENPDGFLRIGESISYAEYCNGNYHSGLMTRDVNHGYEIFRAKIIRLENEDFYRFPERTKKSLSNLFTVQTESAGDLLVVFVADISTDGRVQSTLILTDAAWQKILTSNQRVMRVEQFYLHILEEKYLQMAV